MSPTEFLNKQIDLISHSTSDVKGKPFDISSIYENLIFLISSKDIGSDFFRNAFEKRDKNLYFVK